MAGEYTDLAYKAQFTFFIRWVAVTFKIMWTCDRLREEGPGYDFFVIGALG